MKIIITILTAVLLCGCSDSKRVAALEQQAGVLQGRIAALELRANQQEEQLSAQGEIAARYYSQIGGMLSNTMPVIRSLQLGMEQVLALTNSPVPPVQRVARAINPNQLKAGVPIAIYNQIAAGAAKEWPGNFAMQEHEINRQIEAWQKLNR